MPYKLTLFLCLASLAAAQEPDTSPLVAAFDRFADDSPEQAQVAGDLLLSELSCTACHPADTPRLEPKRGPRLDGVGLRLQREWLLHFIAAPQSVKPGTTMPDVFPHKLPREAGRVLHALVAFLSSQRKPFPDLNSTAGNPIAFEFWKKGDRDRGRRLYHQVGCVACHEPDAGFDAGNKHTSDLDKLLAQLEPDEIRELGLDHAARPVRSVPHGDLAAKYTRRSLTFFLLDPHETRPSGRMPSLKLSPDEAADIASYLLRDQQSDATSAPVVGKKSVDEGRRWLGPSPRSPGLLITDDELIDEGRRWFVELRCANCHDVNEAFPPQPAKRLAQLDMDADRTCFRDKHTGLPHFETSELQTASLRAATAALRTAPSRQPAASQMLHLRMLQLNCYACHERAGQGGVGPQRRDYFETAGHVDLGDEGRLPPPLDGVGRKLTAAWLKKVFDGDGDVRPHMLARMPRFAATAVASLPDSLAQADAVSRGVGNAALEQESRKLEDFGSPKQLADAGRSLLDLGCVQCHPMRGEHLPGVMGIDLAGIGRRVRPEWFRAFLLNPAELKARTRMPTFFPNGRSSVPAVLDGDVQRQIAAMWTYLDDLDHQPLPEKLAASKVHNFELVPDQHPLLLRTFMDDAGTHAIAVGFPSKVHIAFDAESVRISQAWRGKFLDAHGTWFDRFAPPAAPLGDNVINFPPGVPFAVLAAEHDSWPAAANAGGSYRFRGYRFDAGRVPTFLYRFDRFEVEDRFAPTPDGQLARVLRIRDVQTSGETGVLWFRVNFGKQLQLASESTCVNEAGFTTTLSSDAARPGRLTNVTAEMAEWRVPIHIQAETSVEVNYKW